MTTGKQSTSKIGRGKGGIIGVITAGIIGATTISAPYLRADEGRSLVAFWDPNGKVWTICEGETLNVHEGDRMTDKQCDDLTWRRSQEFNARVYYSYDVATREFLELHKDTLAAHGRFAYNVGMGGYQGSQVRRMTAAGKFVEGCHAMLNWYKSGGHDCREDKGKKTGCFGLWTRRQRDADKCEKGLDPTWLKFFGQS